MSVSSLGLFFIVVFITCITPGAGVLYTLKNAINYGKANAFLSPTGNAIGVLFMSTLGCRYADACCCFGSAGKTGRLRPSHFLLPSSRLI